MPESIRSAGAFRESEGGDMSEPNPQYQNQQYNQSPFRLFEGMLPTGAKNLVRGTYGVIGVAALA